VRAFSFNDDGVEMNLGRLPLPILDAKVLAIACEVLEINVVTTGRVTAIDERGIAFVDISKDETIKKPEASKKFSVKTEDRE
jgi:hypothetical protein